MDEPNRRNQKHRHMLKLKELLSRGIDVHTAAVMIAKRLIAQRSREETESHRRDAVGRHMGMIKRAVNNRVGMI